MYPEQLEGLNVDLENLMKKLFFIVSTVNQDKPVVRIKYTKY